MYVNSRERLRHDCFPVVELWTRVATPLGLRLNRRSTQVGPSIAIMWFGTQPRWGCVLNNDGSLLRCSTQGSRVRQPWAGSCNPVGVATESTSVAPLPAPPRSAPLLPCSSALCCSSAPRLRDHFSALQNLCDSMSPVE